MKTEPQLFLSYRRGDGASQAGRVADYLLVHTNATVFLDVDSIPTGANFREHIDRQIAAADVVLAVIGRDWLGVGAGGGGRIEETDDWVRIELETALRYRKPVIPVLVEGATMPEPESLPESLRGLAEINAAELRDGRFWKRDLEYFVSEIPGVSTSPAAAAVPTPVAHPAARRWVWGGAAVLLVGAVAAVALLAGGSDKGEVQKPASKKSAAQPSTGATPRGDKRQPRGLSLTSFHTGVDRGQRVPATVCRISAGQLYCWTPNDGFTLVLDDQGARRVRGDETGNKGLIPGSFSELPLDTRTARSGFRCANSTGGLSCRNNAGAGFELPRYRGLPRYINP